MPNDLKGANDCLHQVYPDISLLYYLALYEITRRRRLYIQIDVGLVSRLTALNLAQINSIPTGQS